MSAQLRAGLRRFDPTCTRAECDKVAVYERWGHSEEISASASYYNKPTLRERLCEGHASEVTVECDRCGKAVQGIELPDRSATGGFYRVAKEYVDDPEPAFARFAQYNETIVCDECMFTDPAYIAESPAVQEAE